MAQARHSEGWVALAFGDTRGIGNGLDSEVRERPEQVRHHVCGVNRGVYVNGVADVASPIFEFKHELIGATPPCSPL